MSCEQVYNLLLYIENDTTIENEIDAPLSTDRPIV